MANCSVCGKPVVSPVPTEDGTMRHARCKLLPVPEPERIARIRRALRQKPKRTYREDD